MTGGVVSTTCTSLINFELLPSSSVAVYVTLYIPFTFSFTLFCIETNIGSSWLSIAVAPWSS